MRGSHKVDVFVTGVVHGIPFRWVVECKYWKTNIPKEKVLALYAIVQDVGADRGFLLSETGFQSGAIRASKSTNITLSSLEHLKLEAKGTLTQSAVTNLLIRREQIHKRLWRLHKATGEHWSEFMMPMSQISILDLALDEGIDGNFPVIYTVTHDGNPRTAEDWDELILRLTNLLDSAEQFANDSEIENVD